MTPVPHERRHVSIQFFLFLPQMRLDFDGLVRRARAAEEHGFRGIALMDHLAPPMAEASPMFEAMVAATWIAAHTDRLIVSHLVLCDALRHPAMLARQAVGLDHASGGRFELGLGWGSVPEELVRFGVNDDPPRARVQRMGESLELIRALWSGEPVNFDGAFFQVTDAQQMPRPIGEIPIVIGGSGPRTLELVARHADWWNLPVHQLHRLERLRERVGDARVSTQHMVAYVPSEEDRAKVTELSTRRFGMMGDGLVLGNGEELIEHFAGLAERGVERCYVWFTDFADPASLAGFGDEVISALA